MKSLRILFTTLLISCALEANGAQTDGSFQATITKQVGLHYRTVTPENYDPQKKYPLLIFLHGRGEQGDDLDKVQIHGPFKKVAELGLPMILVAPQSPEDQWWEADSLSALVNHLLETLPVDTSRIYLTGLSMGGYGTWKLAAHRPEVFAAIAPICGYAPASQAKVLRDTPVWIFHGAKDKVISVSESTEMANALYAVGNDARLTIYPKAEHDSWTETYDNPQLYQWLLSHRKEPQASPLRNEH
ncbi:MAG: prolyl oligopeptidase family serine peptidase [Pirellulales bacterium]|nr:prolyl oligopeptidase family serine peptidase [Pirellulales bacterium]